jgi:isopenicillin-N N-acyltransferase like protein
MRKYRPLFLLALLCLFPAVTQAAGPFRFPEARDGKAELKYVNGVPVLTVGGTAEEIGRAVGTLAVKPGARVLEYPRDLLKIFSAERVMDWFVKGGNGMFRQFPPEYQQELEAMVRAAGVAREPVVVGNTFFDLKKVVACSAVLVQAPRSATGGPLLARNLDYPSLGYIHQYSLVTVYRPAGKHAFASIGFPGLVGCLSGINDAGLSLGVLEVFDVKAGEPSFNAKGVPYALCLRKVLEECTTIDEAQKLLQRLPRTTTINLAIADRDYVAAFEITPGHVVRRDATDNACVCTNHFCAPALKPEEPVDVNASFERFESLEKVREAAKVTPDDLRQHLHTTNMGDLTLQTMVFEPATLKLHLSIGPRPATRGPLRTIDLAPLLKGK